MNSDLNSDILPPEIVTQFLLRLSLKDLINYCLTSKTANTYCQSDAFWKDKYRYDFGLPIPKNSTKLWIDLYKERLRKNPPISAGLRHYAVIDDQGILYMAGHNLFGQLGDGTRNNSKIPIAIKSFTKKVISVSCGDNFTVAITENGKIYGWGRDHFFNGSGRNISNPTLVTNLEEHKGVKVSCGTSSWGVILDDGTVYVLISLITNTHTIIKGRVSLEDKIIDISVHLSLFAAVTERGKLYFSGKFFNSFPEKIIGIEIVDHKRIINPKHVSFPSKRRIIPKIKQVSLSDSHIIALTESGNVFVWGGNISGILGLSNDANRKNLHISPTLLASLPKISFISSACRVSAAVTEDGRLYVWGINQIMGILSNVKKEDKRFKSNTIVSRMSIVPVEIDIGSKVNYISLGPYFAIASTVDGMVNYMGKPDYKFWWGAYR